MTTLSDAITSAFDQRDSISRSTISSTLKQAIQDTLDGLNDGQLRVAEKINQQWHVHEWIKKAILLYFKTSENSAMPGFTQFYDKVPLKYNQHDETQLQQAGVRIVPPATVRYGAFIGKNTVLMPSYVNLGARIGQGSMIDTWATVGSCAQIGNNVHLSGGAGIGGVLEPLQAQPTIIEDNCFIGARSEIVEGVIVEENAVISMGVFIGQSTPIYDRANDSISFGRIPSGAVVIPGSLPSSCGRYNKYAAIIVKQVDANTRAKVSINELLRDQHA